MLRFLRPTVLFLGAFLLIGAASPDRSPEGLWLTENQSGVVDIFRCWAGGTELCGKLVWFRIDPDRPNPQGLDLKNPDPALRKQSLCGRMFMYGFKPADPDSWEGGTIYDAENGNTYHATMNLRPDGTLRLHGYIGISLIGASEIWTRYTQPVPSCPTR
jgi:uncharacterized protein (DUF2147 family)